jgi:hypothetical protein
MAINSATKILGLLLLAAGIVLIGWTMVNSYNIFTGKTAAPKIFIMPEIKTSVPKENTDIQVQMRQMIADQLKGMLPTNSIPQLLNLISWSALASILIFGGGQIASLGIKLIK